MSDSASHPYPLILPVDKTPADKTPPAEPEKTLH